MNYKRNLHLFLLSTILVTAITVVWMYDFSEEKITYEVQVDEPMYKKISFEVVDSHLIFDKAFSLFVKDSLLLIYTIAEIENKNILLYNINTKSIVNRFLVSLDSKIPNNTPMLGIVGDTLSIWERGKFKFYRYNINNMDLLNKSEQLTGNFRFCYYLGNDILYVYGEAKNHVNFTFNLVSKKTIEYDFTPKKIKSKDQFFEMNQILGDITVNHKDMKFVTVSGKNNIISLIEMKDGYHLELKKQITTHAFENFKIREYKPNEKAFYYGDICSNDKYIYIRYSGQGLDSNLKAVNYILKYDWELNLLEVIGVDHYIHSIAVDKKNESLYILAYRNDNKMEVVFSNNIN